MVTKRYLFSELFPNQNPISLSTNTSLTINNSFFDLGDDIFIKSAFVKMKRTSLYV